MLGVVTTQKTVEAVEAAAVGEGRVGDLVGAGTSFTGVALKH